MKPISEILGWKLNNPGNVELGTPKWIGLASVQKHHRFCTFVSPEYGFRVVGYIFRNTYQNKYKLLKPYDLIERYAPGNENDVPAYVKHVCGLIKIDPRNSIDLSNTVLLFDWVKAITTHELGWQPYSDDLIRRGLEML